MTDVAVRVEVILPRSVSSLPAGQVAGLFLVRSADALVSCLLQVDTQQKRTELSLAGDTKTVETAHDGGVNDGHSRLSQSMKNGERPGVAP